MSVGSEELSFASVAGRYYDLYESYISSFSREGSFERSGAKGVRRLATRGYVAVPPVWVGCCVRGHASLRCVGEAASGVLPVNEVGSFVSYAGTGLCTGVRRDDSHGDVLPPLQSVASVSCVCGSGEGPRVSGKGNGECVVDGKSSSGGVLASGESLGSGESRDVNGAIGDSLSEVDRRGKQWWRNQKKAKKRKMASKDWRKEARPLVDGSGGCVSSESDTGSVVTVDTRTAVEIEAAQTLAAKRVAQNKFEIARFEAKTRSFEDKSKTEALGRLEAARMEQRINQAIARSQKAYGETDRSLKSLGSTGSAGEFALKREVKRGEEARIERDYLKEQVGKMLRFVPPSVKEEIANMKPPVFPTDEEIFGDCPDDWSDTEKMDYYDEQERHDAELAARSFDHRIIREPENVVFSAALQEDMRRLRDLTVFE